jgi:hypothetical protein
LQILLKGFTLQDDYLFLINVFLVVDAVVDVAVDIVVTFLIRWRSNSQRRESTSVTKRKRKRRW